MSKDILFLLGSLVIILLSCELFTNGIEWLGKRLKLGDGVVGSIFSAVGTCLPETMIPVIAILFSKEAADSEHVGIGAIVGAPFMLSTLAFFLTGLSVLIFWKSRKTGLRMRVNEKILKRDIGFFIIVYSFGIAVSFTDSSTIRYLVAMFLLFSYVYYIVATVKQDEASHGELEELYITRIFKVKPSLFFIAVQISIALAGIVIGADTFVGNIESISGMLGISALALSLVIAPVATELPEKFNSVLWIRKKKDTLALGNITGAMVFQSCIPVSFGILATAWKPDVLVVISAVLALSSAGVTYLYLKYKNKLTPIPLLTGGIFYTIFIAFLTLRGFR